MKKKINRRKAIKDMAVSTGMVALGASTVTSQACAANSKPTKDLVSQKKELNNNIKHSVCRWCYNKIPLEELAEKAKDMGIQSIEIIGPDDWKVVAKYGLTCAMGNAPFISLTKGFNHVEYHADYQKNFPKLIEQAADAGLENLIVFSGNREGISEEEGLENCAKGLEPIVKHAEKHNIKIVMELLNSKVNHKDYQCDTTPWGVALVDKIGSDHFKLLYDIYHMQIMEGDIIATIKKYNNYFAHYHTGGVPGRNEINQTQELYYPAIVQAIIDTGYKGFLGQEFIPKGPDPIASLEEGVLICDV
jgi:hydroxypyruvate isomerase